MPLILFPFIVLYIVFVIVGTVFIVKRQKTVGKKRLLAILLPTLLFVGPFADEFVARPYFYYLCNQKGGLHVYKTVEIGKENFNEKGELTFLLEAKNSREYLVNSRYRVSFKKTIKYDARHNIRNLLIDIKDELTGEIMAEHNMFLYDYGVLINWISTSMPVQPIKCHKILETEINEIYKAVFLREKL